MGALVSSGILLNDEFDFEQLFIVGLLGVGCGIQDLVQLAWTCKLAETWCRAQLAKCSQEHIRLIILETRIPRWINELQNAPLPRFRTLIWERVPSFANGSGCSFYGLWEFALRMEDALPLAVTDGENWNEAGEFDSDEWLEPAGGTWICAPMFDQAVRYALGMARTPGLDEAERHVLKRARQ